MTRLYLLLGVVAAILALVGAAFVYGKSVERQSWEARTLQKSIDTLRQRKAVNEETRGLPDDRLCALLGGVLDASGQCV